MHAHAARREWERELGRCRIGMARKIPAAAASGWKEGRRWRGAINSNQLLLLFGVTGVRFPREQKLPPFPTFPNAPPYLLPPAHRATNHVVHLLPRVSPRLLLRVLISFLFFRNISSPSRRCSGRCAWRVEAAAEGAWGWATAGRCRSRARTPTAAATCSTTSAATSSRSPPSTSRPSAQSDAAPAASSGAFHLLRLLDLLSIYG
jgi:hypothetical protein